MVSEDWDLAVLSDCPLFNDPNIWELPAFNNWDLLQDMPPGEIEVSTINPFAQYANATTQNAYAQADQCREFTGRLFTLDAEDFNSLLNFDAEDVEFSGIAPHPTGPMLSDHPSCDTLTAELISISIDKNLPLNPQAQLQNATLSASSIDDMNLDTIAYAPLPFPMPTPQPVEPREWQARVSAGAS